MRSRRRSSSRAEIRSATEIGSPRRLRFADIRGEREAELVRQSQAGDRRATDLLLRSNEALVQKISRRYFGLGVDAEDLLQEGRLGYLRALEKFDASLGFALSTYAVRWIRQKILVCLASHCSDVRVEKGVREAYRRMLARGDSVGDLADSSRRVDRILARNVGALLPPDRLDEPRRSAFRPDREEYGSNRDLLADPGPDAEEALHAARTEDLRRSLVAGLLAGIPAGWREVVARRLPLDPTKDPETHEQIGASLSDGRVVTRQRVQQIERLALEHMRRRARIADPRRLSL